MDNQNNGEDELIRLQSTLKPGDAVAFRVMRAGGTRNQQEWAPVFVPGTLPNNGQ